MIKIRALLFIFLALSGCSPVSTSAPTTVAQPSETQAQPASATGVQLVVPTSVSNAPIATQAQAPTSPPNRATPLPAPTLAPTILASPPLPSFSYPIGTPGKP